MSRTPPGVSAGPTDVELLVRWRGGEAAAGDWLFHRHYECVYRFFRNKVPAAATGDLVQKTFLACVEASERFAQHSTFRTYVLGIARHVLADHIRAAIRQRPHEAELGEIVLAELAPAEEVLAAKRERRLLLRALRRLRFPVQLVLELRYWEALSDGEIAEVLDEPVGTVKTRLRAGRLALEDQLTRLAGSPDELRSTLDSLHRWAERVRGAGLAPPDGQDDRRDVG